MMNKDIFWKILDSAKKKSGKDFSLMHQNTLDVLMEYSAEDIYKWGQYFGAYHSFSDTAVLYMAAYVLNSGGDDGFEYFRAWLISQGKKAYFAALESPDSLTNLKIKNSDTFWSEEMLGIAYEAYADKLNEMDEKDTKEEQLSEEEIIQLKSEIVFADESGLDSEDACLSQIPKRIPKLCKLFEYEDEFEDFDDVHNIADIEEHSLTNAEQNVKGEISTYENNRYMHYSTKDDKVMPFIANANLVWNLTIMEGKYLEDISELKNFTSLKRLSFEGYEFSFENIKDFSVFNDLTTLERLHLMQVPHLSDLNFLRNMPKLKDFSVDFADKLIDISAIESLSKLESLSIWRCPITKAPNLAKSKFISHLRIIDNKLMADIDGLKGLNYLEELWLQNCSITDISILDFSRVKDLNLSQNKITDISALKNITTIEMLDLSRNKITDLTPLSNLTSIKGYIDLSGNKIEDVSPLQNLSGNVSIDLRKNKKLVDISPLKNLNISSIHIKGTSVTDFSSITPQAYIDIRDLD